ncbi:response regulator [Teredinibacter haidensis]|uniref:response regulator n=1 Tax=Teredinibacter haidensis TaxID=2731755 RepID=UPI0009489E04|nr:response regulator [Teredinibacter haidensis]
MNEKSLHILIVEDEQDLATLMEDYLLAAGFSCSKIHNGLEVESGVEKHQPDLILLDLMLPGKDGLDICQALRSNNQPQIPIIMVTARVEEIDRLIGLELGADDYICKPFSPREVVARVKAVLRRSQQPLEAAQTGVELHEDSQQVTIQGRSTELTTIEFSLFKLLYNEPGKIFSRQFIMDNIYSDYRIVSDRTVDSHVKKLRKKLHELTTNQDIIHSVYGAGYKYELTPR